MDAKEELFAFYQNNIPFSCLFVCLFFLIHFSITKEHKFIMRNKYYRLSNISVTLSVL